jgi:hypothetical protein
MPPTDALEAVPSGESGESGEFGDSDGPGPQAPVSATTIDAAMGSTRLE